MTSTTDRRRFLACLSEPSRFQLVTTLSSGPRCVTELASLVGLSQSCTTRHLQALLRESIVVAERRGKRVVYALRAEGRAPHPVLQWACEVDGDIEVAEARSVEELPSRRGRRISGPPHSPRASELEADEIQPTIAVEHEGGWVAADVESSDREQVADPVRMSRTGELSSETSTNGTPRRAEMDDFLL